tara:strand:- start:4219 stop:5010 length:792 start_codon:yes stop_codon:yes gene_type:complete
MMGDYYISPHCDEMYHVCEIEGGDTSIGENFKDPGSIYSIIAFSVCMILVSFIMSLSGAKLWSADIKFYFIFVCFSILYMGVTLLVISYTQIPSICIYNRVCREGLINDTIDSVDYYYPMLNCPETPSIGEYYSQLYKEDCQETEYGCCNIKTEEIRCSQFIDEIHSYKEYESLVEKYEGHWELELTKKDEVGSNCPTIEELLYELSESDKFNYTGYTTVHVSMFTIIMICALTIGFRIDKQYENAETEGNPVAQEQILKASA